MHPTTQRVQAQYESYPYPPLEQALGFPVLAALDYVRCAVWPKRESLAGLRVLDAGCGTGHVAVEIARRYPEVEVVGLDLSEASLSAARERAKRAKVGANLSFCQGSLEELSEKLSATPGGSRPFDYIVSSGVLHHLADPAEGARSLTAHLAPDGVMGLMVYAPYGRRGVYVMQDLLRRTVGGRPLPEQIAIARELIEALPPGHPFDRKQFADQNWKGDAGLVDLLLHAQDRSFSVPELRDLLSGAGLGIARFFLPYLYRPGNHLARAPKTAHLLASGGHGEAGDPAAVAELLSGTMSMHVALVTHAGFKRDTVEPGAPAALQGRPLRSPLLRWSERRVIEQTRAKGKPEALKVAFSEHTYTGVERQMVLEGEAALFLDRCDGSRTSEQIFADPGLNAALMGRNEVEKRTRYWGLLSIMRDQDLVFLVS